MNSIFVSIIIPNYNQANYLVHSIRSSMNQSFDHYEILVIDDGSTDNSKEIIREFGDAVKNIRQENKGLAGARNTGILAAKGEYIGLLDADDEWMPNYLDKMIAFANQYPDASVYYCRAQAIDENGGELPQVFGGPALINSSDVYQKLLNSSYIIPSTVLFRKSDIVDIGLFDQELRSCEDFDLWLRLLPEKKIVGINDILARYRIHAKSLSANAVNMQKSMQTVVEKNFGLDDGNYHDWPPNKQRAYGGLYRYIAITSIQRQNDWDKGIQFLFKAINSDPSIASDMNIYYEMALGDQPAGYRGDNHFVDLKSNADNLITRLNNVFTESDNEKLRELRRVVLGTAYFALGLVAYNTGLRTESRYFLSRAIWYRPSLIRNTLLVGNILKSFISPFILERFIKARTLEKI